jgi:hypothetical protein
VFLVLAAASVGVWAWIVAGVLILAGAALGVRALTRPHPPAEDAPRGLRPHDPAVFNVLVVADDTPAPEALRTLVAEHAGGRTTHAFVVAPALSSRLDRLTGDEGAYERASRRLDAALAALEPVSAGQSGKVGSHDPVQAVDEGLREFAADEIVLVVPADSPSHLESHLVDICRERYDVPVTPLGVA